MLITDLLTDRVRRDGSAPLLTCYDVGDGSRTELSATTFANWVAKASNLVVDELDLDAGDAVAVPLLREAPGHWMSLVWVMALWATGAHPRVVAPGEDAGEVAVVGPAALADPDAVTAGTVLVCSLHPLGLGFREPLPAGWVDWSTEVRSQPDRFAGVPPTPELPAWAEPDLVLTQDELVTQSGVAERVLVRPGDPWPTVAAALVRPLIGGGSAVVVTGGTDADLDRIRAEENVA
ncbi:TIGR03089 family protein [Desertihabitans aurantiacus]|uniref:TIGR03089 family protein n=1 Tax=Desertihabitans aurantiacus TaxID=2282477 RepID=UPI0013003BA0|nr:TIGR03089 family protein [Desertihabitans aurantiacus]